MGGPNYHHGNLKQALINAGLEILKQEGQQGLSLRACAARAGVSHGAPKNHFANAAVLQAAIVTEGFCLFANKMAEYLEKAPNNGPACVLAIARGYLEFAEDNPDLFRLMFSSGREVDIYPDLLPASQKAYAVLRDVCRWIDFGDPGNPEDRLKKESMLWSWIHGYTSLRINSQFYTSNREIGHAPQLEDILLDLKYHTEPLKAETQPE